jgi:hypothetical protein
MRMTGTQPCDRCYELEKRIKNNPAAANKILGAIYTLRAFPLCVTYEELRDELGKLPSTWYPDLIRSMVEAAYTKKVFVKGGASRLISNLEKRIEESADKEETDGVSPGS